MSDEPLGRRLRLERERRRITLESIAANTKIGVSLLRALEADDVSRLPTGIFRRAIVRSYAGTVGLDADETLAEFAECFPDSPGLATKNGAAPPSSSSSGKQSPRRSTAGLRLTLADSHYPFSGGRLLQGAGVRLRAVACDLATLASIGTAAFVAVHQFWLVLAVVAVAYYAGGILLLGSTPGVLLFARKAQDATPPRPIGAQLAHSAFDDL